MAQEIAAKLAARAGAPVGRSPWPYAAIQGRSGERVARRCPTGALNLKLLGLDEAASPSTRAASLQAWPTSASRPSSYTSCALPRVGNVGTKQAHRSAVLNGSANLS